MTMTECYTQNHVVPLMMRTHLRPMIQLMKSQTTTDSSSTATGIDDGDDENNDMKEYPNVLIKRRPTKENTVVSMTMTECYTQNLVLRLRDFRE